ncbi:MAG: hypothetical protein M9925_04505 [Chloroflexi bacterium]|nr:hypothetical protein [Chloroflexota bacterium]
MPDTFVRTRCSSCARPLGFDDWSNGSDRCQPCVRARSAAARTPAPPDPLSFGHAAFAARANAYERMLDDIPDELVDELVAALEAEAARMPSVGPNPVREVLSELGLGRSPRERHWAAWGFAAGFAANIVIAKYAQMTTAAPMSQFIGPMLLGGLLAGATCSAIGWGFARLRER